MDVVFLWRLRSALLRSYGLFAMTIDHNVRIGRTMDIGGELTPSVVKMLGAPCFVRVEEQRDGRFYVRYTSPAKPDGFYRAYSLEYAAWFWDRRERPIPEVFT